MYKVRLILLAGACAVCLFGCRKQTAPPLAMNLHPKYGAKINPQDGAEMALIPAGEFLMGTSDQELAAWLQSHPGDKREWFINEQPQHKVILDAFYMYQTEVTVTQYRIFCQATGRPLPPNPYWKPHGIDPIVGVTWDDAQAYAEWAGATLPTEAQWEMAARCGDRRVFPWGDAWPPPRDAGNFADQTCKQSGEHPKETFIDGYTDGFVHTCPVNAFSANPYGLRGLAGNVAEWCADWYGEVYYAKAPVKNPPGPSEALASIGDIYVKRGEQIVLEKGKARVLRGGSWGIGIPGGFRAASRISYPPATQSSQLGFRCVMRVPGKTE